MISIKIQCSCGQKFVFDVEPVGGRMPSTVTCPECGVDATQASNESIQAQLAQSAAAVPRSKTLLVVGVCMAVVIVPCLAGGAFLWWKSRSEAVLPEPTASVAQVAPGFGADPHAQKAKHTDRRGGAGE